MPCKLRRRSLFHEDKCIPTLPYATPYMFITTAKLPSACGISNMAESVAEWLMRSIKEGPVDWVDQTPLSTAPCGCTRQVQSVEHVDTTVSLLSFPGISRALQDKETNSERGVDSVDPNTVPCPSSTGKDAKCFNNASSMPSLEEARSSSTSSNLTDTNVHSYGAGDDTTVSRLQWTVPAQTTWKCCMGPRGARTVPGLVRGEPVLRTLLRWSANKPKVAASFAALEKQYPTPALDLRGLGVFLLSRRVLAQKNQFAVLPRGIAPHNLEQQVKGSLETEIRIGFPPTQTEVALRGNASTSHQNGWRSRGRVSPTRPIFETRQPAIVRAFADTLSAVSEVSAPRKARSSMKVYSDEYPPVRIWELEAESFAITTIPGAPTLRIRTASPVNEAARAHVLVSTGTGTGTGTPKQGNRSSQKKTTRIVSSNSAARVSALPSSSSMIPLIESIVKIPILGVRAYDATWVPWITANNTVPFHLGNVDRASLDTPVANPALSPILLDKNASDAASALASFGARAAAHAELDAQIDVAVARTDTVLKATGVRKSVRIEAIYPIVRPSARMHVALHLTRTEPDNKHPTTTGGVVAEVDFTDAFLQTAPPVRTRTPPTMEDLTVATAEVVWSSHWLRLWLAAHLQEDQEFFELATASPTNERPVTRPNENNESDSDIEPKDATL